MTHVTSSMVCHSAEEDPNSLQNKDPKIRAGLCRDFTSFVPFYIILYYQFYIQLVLIKIEYPEIGVDSILKSVGFVDELLHRVVVFFMLLMLFNCFYALNGACMCHRDHL